MKIKRFKIIVFESQVLNILNSVSNTVQNKNPDVGQTTKLIKTVFDGIKSICNNFESIKAEAVHLAKQWGISPVFREKKTRKSQITLPMTSQLEI